MNHDSSLLIFELFPDIKLYCPVHKFKSIQGILLKLHKMIKDIERQCGIPLLYLPF